MIRFNDLNKNSSIIEVREGIEDFTQDMNYLCSKFEKAIRRTEIEWDDKGRILSDIENIINCLRWLDDRI